jgi:preprotein translocase subunit SecD
MVESATVSLDSLRGWQVNPVMKSGPNGIDKFNVLATLCFQQDPTICPSPDGNLPGAVAIVLDHEVISAPSINVPIFSRDQIEISGSFDETSANRLAESLRFGALPLELVAQETRTVSASIGSDVLSSGVVAGLIGLTLVAIYLLAYYRLAGLVAISGLILSGMLLWTIVAWFGSAFGLALTLSGVVGLIVAIGVSADSNIVYFENVKDSYRSGRRIPTAVERAYETAISTIIKADVVSLIAAVLLYLLTVGAVRGFAFYLGLATILDLVISMMFMRPMLAWLARLDAVEKNPKLLGLPTDVGPDAGPLVGSTNKQAGSISGGAS